MSTSPRKTFYGWYVAATAFSIYFFTNGMTLFVPQNLFPRFMESFSATAAEVSRTTGISLMLVALMAPVIGTLIDRVGALRFVRTGLVVMAICFSLYPFAQSLNHLYMLHAFLALGFGMAGLMVQVVLLSKWFVVRRGAVIGMLAAGSSLAGALLPPIISPLVNNPDFGWRWGFGSLAIAFWLLALIPGFFILKESPSDIGAFPDGASQPPPATDVGETDGVTFLQALRSRTLYCLAISSACIWFSIQAVNSQATIFFELEAGLSPQRATLLFSLLFWFSVAGKFLFGAFSDYFPKQRVMLVASVVLLAGCLLLFTSEPEGIVLTSELSRLILFAVVFGLGFGGSFTMIQLVTVESFGQRALGKILGTIILIDSFGAAGGTFLAGQLKTSSGGYFLPFAVVTVVSVVAVINVLFIRPVVADN